ncbi:MAG: sensor histidine kinase [Anaerolineales bacterium]|nr:sensor histidine kinase [Anaerolineales bacterium]
METEDNFNQKVKDLIFPSEKTDNHAAQEIFPFYLMVTVAMAWMYMVYIRQIDNPLSAVIFTILMVMHVGLYWGIFLFLGNALSLRLYFIFQGLLAFVIVFFAEDYGLAIGLYASLIGNAVGALQEKKDLLYFIPGYLFLGVLSIVISSGVEVVLEWSFTAIPSILLSGFIAFMFRRLLQTREKTEALYQDLQKAHTRLADYAKRVEELTLAEERQRIARELHDTLAQELTGVVLQLEAVSTHIEQQNNARAQEILQNAMFQSRVTLAEARKVIDGLRSSPAAGQTMRDLVQQEAIHFESVAQIPCKLQYRMDFPLQAELQDHILKIITEGLNNIAKHADASQAWLRVTGEANRLMVEIEDNGRGFSREDRGEGQYGLLGIRERADLLQGHLSIDSQPGRGTRLQLEIPLKKAGDSNE